MNIVIPRLIPVLLLRGTGLVKTRQFKDAKYLGDPINIVRIFNEKEVDEIVLLDIMATATKTGIQYDIVSNIAGECFMPMAYGGGIYNLDQMDKVFRLGVEKVIINTAAVNNPRLITEASVIFGSQSIIVAIDIKKNNWGKYYIYKNRGKINTKIDPIEFSSQIADRGAGEIIVNSIDNDGCMGGYDIGILRKISERVSIPVIACGGAGNLDHVKDVIKKGKVSAAAAGSLFVFKGKYRAVLITYPSRQDIINLFSSEVVHT